MILATNISGVLHGLVPLGCFFAGELFASGGADKTVILWNNNLEGMLKFM